MTTSPHELDLTPDRLEYAKAVALIEAEKRCPRHVDFDDVVQDALLHLMSKPPRFDPTRGASPKTLIYTVVQRAVMKFVAREVRHAGRHKQVMTPQTGDDEDREAALEAFSLKEQVERRRKQLLVEDQASEDIFDFIDNEDSRALCRLYIKCNGNASDTARLLGVHESTVRYRLRMLAPKLRAAGFDPFAQGGGT
jgi:RNA polymerase sigma factor (sigma-70 family)